MVITKKKKKKKRKGGGGSGQKLQIIKITDHGWKKTIVCIIISFSHRAGVVVGLIDETQVFLVYLFLQGGELWSMTAGKKKSDAILQYNQSLKITCI